MGDREAAFLQGLDARVDEILDRCSGCGRCVEVCPTAGPAGIDRSDPQAIVADVLDLLRGGGDRGSRGARWAETCTGSGACIKACDDGVNPRFMLAMTRVRLNQAKVEDERRAAGQKAFHTMSRSVKVLSRLQLPAEFLGHVTRSAHAAAPPAPADVIMYLGCNVLKTPHIALLCLDVLDRIGTTYKVHGGPANCCGILQFRAGDTKGAGRVGGNTVAGFRDTGVPRVLTWCPTCNIQLGEVLMPSMAVRGAAGGEPSEALKPVRGAAGGEPSEALKPVRGAAAGEPSEASKPPGFALEHVVPYVADRLELLTPHFTRRIEKRVALHEHPGVAGVTEGVLKILGAIPGLEIVDLAQPRVGYMCNSLAPVAAYKRELHANELAAAEAAGVDCLVGIYHACHRELCAHEATVPFQVVNFLELVGEAMGLERPDLFKQWKMMQDVDRVLADLGDRPEVAGLDVEAVREVMVAHMLGEQPLPVGRSS